MPLPVPEIPENRAADFARNIVLRFNQAEENVGREYIATYEQTWGVSELGKGSIHTQQQMLIHGIGMERYMRKTLFAHKELLNPLSLSN